MPRVRAASACLIALTTIAFLVYLRPAAGEDLVGHWAFDKLERGSTPEAAGRQSAATASGVVLAESPNGSALRFDGVDDYVALGDLGEYPIATIAFWVKPERAEKKDDWQALVSSDCWDEGFLHIAIRDRAVEVHLHLGQQARGRVTSPPLTNGRWYHVAITADAVEQSLSLKINGFEVDYANLPKLSTKIKLAGMVAGREFDGQRFSRYFAPGRSAAPAPLRSIPPHLRSGGQFPRRFLKSKGTGFALSSAASQRVRARGSCGVAVHRIEGGLMPVVATNGTGRARSG